MFANVVHTEYKNGNAIDQVKPKVQEIANDLRPMSGFKQMFMVRTGEKTTVNVVVFESEEDARSAREKLFPKFKDAVKDHVAGEPRVTPGPVVLSVSPK